jgi:dynein heavy chain
MIGLINGQTMLPMPSAKLVASESTPDKDKAHIFESSIITWTKQIKNVLKLEPEQALKQGNDPGPLTELEFWEKKANNLNSIYEQLESNEVQNILRFLEGNKSTYTNPFSKLQKEVMNSRIEANDNFKYLNTLRPWFNKLVDSGKEFNTTHDLYLPIMHLILLIWKKSKFYNTPPRLVVLIREICNAIITKARDFMPGPAIFQLISSEETYEACEKLATTIDVCTKFKDAYFEYKAKAENTWKLTTNALFVRLDSFLERCHDILHLTMTIVQFNKLAKIELGGTKGKSLTETLNQIFVEFKKTVE